MTMLTPFCFDAVCLWGECEIYEVFPEMGNKKEKTSIFIEAFSWFRLELNQRHADFQSTALPTELQNHFDDPKIV